MWKCLHFTFILHSLCIVAIVNLVKTNGLIVDRYCFCDKNVTKVHIVLKLSQILDLDYYKSNY